MVEQQLCDVKASGQDVDLEMRWNRFPTWKTPPGGVWLVQLPGLRGEKIWSCGWTDHWTGTDCFRAFVSASFPTDDD